MRMIDENGREISAHDPARGYLVEAQILVCHHEAVEAVEEVGHYEVAAEYPNGGKDLAWVVDVPGVEAREAWDEFEDVLQFVPFTDQEIRARRITELKQLLRDSDYQVLKVVEGATTLLEIAGTIAKRAAWRKEINELEERQG